MKSITSGIVYHAIDQINSSGNNQLIIRRGAGVFLGERMVWVFAIYYYYYFFFNNTKNYDLVINSINIYL